MFHYVAFTLQDRVHILVNISENNAWIMIKKRDGHIYSHGQNLTHTCNEQVYNGSLEFQ